MFKIYLDDQFVRGVFRVYPEGGEGHAAIDIGCGAGRHTKLLLESGFWVKAIDIDGKNIQDTWNTLRGCPNLEKLSCECKDFCEINETEESFVMDKGVNDYLAYFNLGVVYECIGRNDEAKQYYLKCENYEPAKQRLKEMNV